MDQLKGTRAAVRAQMQAMAAATEGSGRSRARDGLDFVLVLGMITGALFFQVKSLDFILVGSGLTIAVLNAMRGKKGRRLYDAYLLRAALGLVAGHI